MALVCCKFTIAYVLATSVIAVAGYLVAFSILFTGFTFASTLLLIRAATCSSSNKYVAKGCLGCDQIHSVDVTDIEIYVNRLY